MLAFSAKTKKKNKLGVLHFWSLYCPEATSHELMFMSSYETQKLV